MRHTKFYLDYIQSEAWRQKKAAIVEQRGYKCESCDASDYVELHHKNYDRLGRELDSDLQLLCSDCHKTADRFRASYTQYNNARATYIRKKYGDYPPSYVDEEFDDWLRRKRGDY